MPPPLNFNFIYTPTQTRKRKRSFAVCNNPDATVPSVLSEIVRNLRTLLRLSDDARALQFANIHIRERARESWSPCECL